MRPADAVFIGEARKSRGQVVKIFVGHYEGKPFIYLSVFDKGLGETDGQAVDLLRGVTLNPTCWRELLPVIETAISRTQEDRLVAGLEDGSLMDWDRSGRRDRRQAKHRDREDRNGR